MKKWLKVVLIIIILLAVLSTILYNFYLKASYLPEPILTGTLIERSINIKGQKRDFLYYVPKQITNNSLVFVLHGSTGTGEGVREQTAYQFDELADKEGFVVVYPTGYANHWNDCRGTADYEANTKNIDDISFFKEIENYLNKQLNLTFAHRFATGHSNGGHFAFKLALEAPDWIDGIAAISANLPISENLDCQKSGQFVPVLLINGTADGVNPYNGGLVSILGNDSRGTVLSTEKTMEYWTKLGGCKSEATITNLPNISKEDNSNIELFTWYCNNRPRAMLYKVIGGGHTIPHTKSKMPRILGVTNKDINATAEIWTFFKKQIE